MAEATYSYDQLAEWYSKHGGGERGREAVKQTVPNPGFDPSLPENPTVNPRTITVDAIKLTATDGSTIIIQEQTVPPDAVNPNPKPQYIVHEHLDAPAKAPTAASTQPKQTAADEALAAELQRQRERNAALPPEQDPAYETDAERRARGRQTVLDQEARAAKDKAAADKEKADAAAAEAKNRPTISYKQVNGKTYKVLTYPDGREEVSESALPADVKDDAITTVNGQPARVVRDANGKATGLEVLPVSGQGTDPTYVGSMPSYVPKPIADDLKAYSEELAAAVKSGAITPARATALMDARLKAAQAAADNELDAAKTVYGAGVNQRGQDVTLANQRLNESGANFRQSLTSATSINDWVNPGSDAGWRLFQALLAQGQEQAKLYGGLKDIPREPVPAALQRAAGITVTSPDGTVVTIPSGSGIPAAPASTGIPQPTAPVPPSPNMNPAELLGSMRAPQTGVGAVDAMGQQMAQQRERPPLTFDSMEESFRRFGMDEDAIQASRRNFMGAGVG